MAVLTDALGSFAENDGGAPYEKLEAHRG